MTAVFEKLTAFNADLG